MLALILSPRIVYLSGVKSSSVKQNLRIAIELPLICRSSRCVLKMTQNVSLDLGYVPSHKPCLILIVHREIIVLK